MAAPYRLLVSDMDSTVAETETIVDMAEALGIADTIAAITERSMRGELDFRTALDERVMMLRGLELSRIEAIARDVRLSVGAGALLDACRAAGMRTVLGSGGFDLIADVVGAALGFDRVAANRLDFEDGRLTGRVLEPIVTAETKLAVLREECAGLGIDAGQAVALGDGANDIEMIRAAGLGVAYQGKPVTRDAADLCIDDLNDLIPHLQPASH
ncbi:MAG: Phosphoserine phosphatase [Rhodospirillaceae bacterium]|nr:MAG: Phosphoserine phosphatase [Rhodospirillaceae bacterium]